MIQEGASLPHGSWSRIRATGRNSFGVAWLQATPSWLVLFLLAAMASAAAQTGSPVPTAEIIIARMAQARVENRTRLRPYVVTRNYKLFGKDESKAKSEVIANIAFVPPGSKKYTIQQTNGSALGQILVRRMLANEADVTKNYVSTDLSTDNYDFRFIREEDVVGKRCYVLELLPRRKENHLLHGNVWVDSNTYLLRRFEGELARTPSWWVRDVSVTFDYGDVGGMWLQTASEAAADVRILGRSRMVSRDVNYKITDLVAAGSVAQPNLLNPILDQSLRPSVVPAVDVIR